MLIQADASQLEWRTLLYLSQDPVGMAEVIEKQDAHSLNEKAFDLPSRLIAKIYLFRTIYRGSGWAFAHDPAFMHVSKDPKFWDAVGEKFYSKYAGIDKCHQEWANLVTQGLPIVGPFGREWFCSNRNKKGEFFIPWTTLTNYPVQGTGADIMALARVSFARRLKATGWPVLLVSTVHDSIVVDCPDPALIQPVVNLFHQVFDDIPANIERMFGVDWNVPMDCECKVGANMKDMHKVPRNDK
jgi:DNA polymerase I-like protein with 3'-5' exonuclease and polymerase domains